MHVATLQQELLGLGFDPGPLDGILGFRTYSAINQVLEQFGATGWRYWSLDRRQIAAEQCVYKALGIEVGEIDGLVGPQTRYAREAYPTVKAAGRLPTWRDPLMAPKPGDLTKSFWPQQADVERFYGPVGQNQAQLQLPYLMRLAWDKEKVIARFSIHEKVHDSALRVLKRVLEYYGENEIRRLGLDLFGGCLNVRKMRGGSAYSMHSWGIAIDFDPECNQLHWGRDRARLARPEYDAFWRFWTEEGWVSLGQARNFDWMHVQAARL